MSQIVNGSTGKVVHEITSTGAVYYGDTTEPGDINETAQFAIAADLIWRWSGDNAVLADNYKFIDEGEHYLASLATGPGGLWPVGDGIVENTSLGGEALDVASETIQALAVLHDMAVAMHDTATASWAAQREQAMLKAFGQWWISSQHLYADSMCAAAAAGASCTAAGQQLQQRWWTSVAPMEQDIAPVADADAALGQLETPTFTGSCGLYVDGVGGPAAPAARPATWSTPGPWPSAKPTTGACRRPSPTWTRSPASSPWRCLARCRNWPRAPSTTRSRRSPAGRT